MSESPQSAVSLSTDDYRRLRRATETHREELVVRLAGEVGLRPAEVVRVRPSDATTHRRNGVDHHLLCVPNGDGDTARRAYLPADVEHDLRQYARTAGVAADDPLVDVSARRVQMLVSEVADRAADRAGDPRLREASSQTLRAFFARRLLVDEGVDPRVVASVGGWSSLASLDQYLGDTDPEPEAVADAFAPTALAPPDATAATATSSGPRFEAVFDRARAVADALDAASTREEVESRVCETLVEDGAYAAAWVGASRGEAVDVAAAADAGAPDGVGDGAVAAALRTERVHTTGDVGADAEFAAWREHAERAGYRAAAAVPVVDGETTYGVLGVGADVGEFGERERALLADLGRRVGRALTVVEQRKLLLADTVVEVAFETDAGRSFFARAAAEHGCELELDGVVPGEDQSLLYFVTLRGAAAGDVLSWATDESAVDDARLVRDYGDEALLEVVLSGPDVAKALTERGATVRELVADADGQRVVGEVPADADVRALADDLAGAFPGVELVSKRERERSGETRGAFRASLHESLTDKQAAVLQAAYHAGYFEWPRGSTAEELADAIGITSPTLHNHLRRAQQKLLTAFFEDDDPTLDAESPWPDR
ncbi:bacterio-opsin activator domain-containing protein [Halobacterium litoreum]|uniref:Bacterio-opsin activator domain-containing protein n=1 Tax=Halobacterium litoreum TaxID=2039234 RepID=A0ABD5NA67_9EURY|nr:bacterio-opsin activator domain-containing protein [Halobacterium litoreum]UHH14801.1 helix-turn-helix domain-containing protein [Halobacterium litoreum]